MEHMLIGMALDMVKLLAALAVLGAALMAYPRTRRVLFAVVKFSKANMSPWMLAVAAASLAFPGALDDIVVLPVLFILMLRTKAKRVIFYGYVREAWKGPRAPAAALKRAGYASGR